MARDRLDVPKELRRPIVPTYDAEAFGRLSERIARFLGTGRFLVYMTVTILFWIGWNVLLPQSLRFDEYPFIFLTLMLSLQASYAAPLILLAQTRQAERDKMTEERTEQHRPHQAEHRRSGADADCECRDRHERVRRVLTHGSQGIADVLQRRFDQRDAAPFAMLLLDLHGSSKTQERGAPGVVR